MSKAHLSQSAAARAASASRSCRWQLVDFLGCTDHEPFLIETDTSVPDVFKTYKGDMAASS